MLKVFVYGTLLPGEANFHVIERYFVDSHAGTVKGKLYDYGPYPGLVLDEAGLVEGEWLTLQEEALLPMDRLEGYEGPGQINDYERIVITDAHDNTVSGWIYVWPDSRGYPLITGGSWREHVRRARN